LPIILVGTRGEVPILYQDKKKPIQDAVPPGKIVLGYWLGQDLKPADKVVLQGRAFTVHQLHPKRGTQDDITAWINLREAQEMAGKPGLINGMLALGCNCTADRLSIIREEIAKVLPETQVEEFESIARARADARTKTAEEAKAALARERAHRANLRAEKESFAAALVPVVLLGACVWLGLLAMSNVRERRGEIGLLRALGFRSGQLLVLFLARAAGVGLCGALLGVVAGVLTSLWFGEAAPSVWETTADHAPLLGLALVATPAVSALACWLPALLAVRQDPAVVLQQEAT
jgi:putative ABC transport system permease protein